jgi:hypothetical protein
VDHPPIVGIDARLPEVSRTFPDVSGICHASWRECAALIIGGPSTSTLGGTARRMT